MNTHCKLALVLALALVSTPLFALSNSFSYQGSLSDGGTPANGSYDLQFQLQTAAGSNVAAPLVREDVAVSGGLFSVELDFGSAITSAAFRLQIGVRPGTSTGAFTTLSPATNIRPTPQAQVAGIASEAVTVSPNAINSTSIADGTIGGADIAFGTVAGSNLASNSVNSLKIVDGSVGLADIDVTQVQRRVAFACPAGSSISAIAETGAVTCETDDAGTPGWSLTGNAGTNPSTQFIGTTDAQPLQFRANNERVLRIEPNPLGPNLIGGFSGNTVTTGVNAATISGGGDGGGTNRVTDNFGVVAGGADNRAGNDAGSTEDARGATIGGGIANIASGGWSTVGAGLSNTASGTWSTVSGGGSSSASADYSTVSGGQANTASGTWSTVGGGELNTASGEDSTVSGGFRNAASGARSSVGGGSTNTASGDRSTVSGGILNCAGGDRSWASGNRAKVRPGTNPGSGSSCSGLTYPGGAGDAGTFVWADSQNADFVSSGADQFNIRAQGGVGINTPPRDVNVELTIRGRTSDAFGGNADVQLIVDNANQEGIQFGASNGGTGSNDANFEIAHANGTTYTPRMTLFGSGTVTIRSNNTAANTGVTMAANAGSWSSLSDRRLKTGIVPVNASDVLSRVIALPMATWSYIAQGEAIRHMGPMAQDFSAAFGLGENNTTIATIDADGVALAAIQGLNQKLEGERDALRAENAELRARLERIERRLNQQDAARAKDRR